MKNKEEKSEEIKEEKQKKHKRSGFGAIFLIFLGVMFLLNNFNIVPWSVWGILLRFWPVILIFLGINTLFSGSLAGRIVIFILSLVFFISLCAMLLGMYNAPTNKWLKDKIPFLYNMGQLVPKKNYFNEMNNFKMRYNLNCDKFGNCDFNYW